MREFRSSHCMQPSSFICVFQHRIFVAPCLSSNPVTHLTIWVRRTLRPLWGRILFSIGISDTLLVRIFASGCLWSRTPEGTLHVSTKDIQRINPRDHVVKSVSRFVDDDIPGRSSPSTLERATTVETTPTGDVHFTEWFKFLVHG